MDINKVVLIGRLVRDPEYRVTADGVGLTRMRIAVNRKPAPDGSQQADFIDLVAWRGLAELCNQYLRKGSRIAVEGSIRQRSWQDNEGNYQNRVEVEVHNLQFLDPKGKQEEPEGAAEAPEASVSQPNSDAFQPMDVLDDDLDDFTFEDGEEE